MSLSGICTVYKYRAKCSFHDVCAYPALVMGTWLTKIVFEWLEMPAYLYDLLFPRGYESAQMVCVL